MRLRVAALACVVFAACEGEVIDMNEPPVDDGGLGGGGGSATGGGEGGGGGAVGGGGGEVGGGGGATGGGGGAVGGGGGATGGGGGATGGGGGATGGGAGGGGSGVDGGVPSCTNIVGDRQTQVCLRWACDRRDMSEGTWNGQVNPVCDPGDMTAAARANALRLVNLYRFIANQPAVVTDATKDANAQACALMMDANNTLSHTPPSTWACYTSAGATAAGQSNICSGRAVKCVDMYMSDYGSGNAASIGHRRWLLSNSLGPMGIGGTTGGSCHLVIGGSGSSTQPWIAWPPPGPVPLEAINIPGVQSVDSVGWTVQSYGSAWNLAGAVATVKDNGTSVSVTTTQLGANFGSPYAIRINPQGWTSQAGHTYDVEVLRPDGGVLLNYQVQPVTCPPAPP